MGVYLWAHFTHGHRPAGPPYPDLPKRLIYVGETNDLNMRLLGPAGRQHHRLRHYVTRFRDEAFDCLYISVFHIEPFRQRDKRCNALRAYTRYVEDLVLWKYTEQFEERPALDYKTGKDEWRFPTRSAPLKRRT